MSLNCCSRQLMVEDSYYLRDSEERIVQVFKAHCSNPKCRAKAHKGLVLEIHSFESSKVLRGFDAVAFDAANPKPKTPIVIDQLPDKATWIFGKGFERINKTKKIKTKTDNSYSLSTGKKCRVESKAVVRIA